MTEDYRKNAARVIKQRRISMGLNLKEVAVRAGISSSHLGRIERGERSPSFTVLRKIANPLGFGEKDLLALAGYLPSQPSNEAEERTELNVERLDPYVAMVLSQEPVGVQRTVIGILSILKSIAREQDAKRGHDVTDVSG